MKTQEKKTIRKLSEWKWRKKEKRVIGKKVEEGKEEKGKRERKKKGATQWLREQNKDLNPFSHYCASEY